MEHWQTLEAEAFISRILSLPKLEGPGDSLDKALQPSLDDEAELRKLFATDKTNSRLRDPYVGLVDVFAAPPELRTTRARVVKDEQDLSAQYVMPLSDSDRRKEGTPSMVADLDGFKNNWSIFTEGSLFQLLDWNNVVAAGGAVLACLSPLTDAQKETKRSIRKHYHSVAYPTSDVDLFLWGLDPEQAEIKINSIYEAVRDSVPWDVTCVRTKHTVSIHSQYPYRSVQIVLRLYSSPAEMLAGFDIDAPCCLYNGQRVFANPRAIVAMMRQCNTVNMTRRSPSYEVRLTKYSSRSFEVYITTLKRDQVDPTIYERSIARIEGLARLLAFEKLVNANARDAFMLSRKSLRGRPLLFNRSFRRKRKYKGDLKADMAIGGLEMNDYDVATLHIPYGPGWHARRIDKLVYQTDLGMNSTFNPKNKGRRLHRHPAFFGTMKECMDDCCEHCPEPIDADERELQTKEDKHYIRGRILFIKEDPGRQSISGSFNPIDVGEWSAQVYIGETERFFTAVTAHDRESVSKMITGDGIDINRRDHVGRTALHVAILSKATDIACDLIDAGARISARLVDGRNALHIAAQFDQQIVARKLLERSVSNEQQLKNATANRADDDMEEPKGGAERPSSEDDWSSEDGGVIALDTEGDGGSDGGDGGDEGEGEGEPIQPVATVPPTASNDSEVFPEDQTDAPDLLDVNLFAWDHGFSPLAYAVLYASKEMVDVLLAGGADPHLLNATRDSAFHLLAVLILREDDDEACRIFERLVLAGVSASTADDQMRTIFHRAVMKDKLKLVSSILHCDPNAKAVLDFPAFFQSGEGVISPIVSAIAAGKYAMLALLLAHGAKVVFTEEDISKALSTASPAMRQRHTSPGMTPILHRTYAPLEVAIARLDNVAHLLISLGAEVNFGISQALVHQYTSAMGWRSIKDWVQWAIFILSEKAKARTTSYSATPLSWMRHVNILNPTKGADSLNWGVYRKSDEVFKYLRNIDELLASRDAKTWNSLYPDKPSAAQNTAASKYQIQNSHSFTYLVITLRSTEGVPRHLNSAYDELYEACITGDNKKVQQLCLPQDDSDANESPLNIYVQTADPSNQHRQTGITPLYAAIAGRHWETARLVLAIAAAQYHPKNDEKKFTVDEICLDDLSDNESDDSGDSDETIEEEEIVFIDIAKKPSKVQTDVHPSKLLDGNFWCLSRNPDGGFTSSSTTHLQRAVTDNDFDGFVNIANLYKTSPLPIAIDSTLLDHIIAMDQPDMLDEYIRRTGGGIDTTIVKERGAEIVATNDANKLYLGLHVHGKKRADLAKKNDRNAAKTGTGAVFPMLWKACLAGVKGIIEYLAGDRPLAAYRFYASTRNEVFALQLRRTVDFEEVLPQWLGWVVTPLRESPLVAGVLGRNLDIVKMLFTKNPKLMGSCIHDCVKFTGYNALMIAADINCSPALVDFLLAKSVSAQEKDKIRGWNIYHILCANNHCDLLEHLLQKLPQDVSEMLLVQQSKDKLNTPLHIAVKSGCIRATKLIINFSKPFASTALLLRDIDCCTPLHCAVHSGFSDITEVLLTEAPPSALHMENGVGKTPLEIAFTLECADESQNPHSLNPPTLNTSMISPMPFVFSSRANVSQLEGELLKLRAMIEQLTQEGLLIKGTTIADELVKFADMMDTELVEAKAAEAKKAASVGAGQVNTEPIFGADSYGSTQPTWAFWGVNVQPLSAAPTPSRPLAPINDQNPPRDAVTRGRTLGVISKAVSAAPGQRQLVRLLDVHKSVHGDLARLTKHRETNRPSDEDELKVDDVDAEQKERDGSLLLEHVNITPDTA